jgi:RNA polymerase sigma-70 factor (ECF subfamily)
MQDLDALHAAIAAGNSAAFGQFLGRAELTVRRSLKTFSTRVDTEAILQEAFLRLWQVAPRFTPDKKPNGLLRLLVRIAQNLALDEVKRRREVRIDDDIAPPPELISPLVEVDPLLRDIVKRCFDRLPPQPSRALGARLESEGAEPDSVIAERIRMKPNTFFQNVARARRLLADCLQEHGVALPDARSPTPRETP